MKLAEAQELLKNTQIDLNDALMKRTDKHGKVRALDNPNDLKIAVLLSEIERLDKDVNYYQKCIRDVKALIESLEPPSVEPKVKSESQSSAQYNVHSKSASIMPNNLPQFGEKHITDIRVLIEDFELILDGYSLTLDHHWKRLLPFCFLDIVYKKWVRTSLIPSNESWSEAKHALIAHFDNPLERVYARQKLYTASQHKGEDIRHFGDRFCQLMREANEEDGESIAAFFLSRLGSSLQEKIATACAARPEEFPQFIPYTVI